MSNHTTRIMQVVGYALIAAGAVVAAIGSAHRAATVVAVVPVFGGALAATGIVTVMRWSNLRSTQAIIAGATLVAAGVVAAVVGTATGDPQATIALPAIGAAITTGGLATLITGTNERAAQTN